jgi:hypothetical protein
VVGKRLGKHHFEVQEGLMGVREAACDDDDDDDDDDEDGRM